jgi:hypothetical protein
MQYDATETSIRTVLLNFLKKEDDPSCVFLSELFVDGFSRRADLVVANGHLAAFEIKSASDKLSRLKGQLDSYKKNFEATTIVCSHKHLSGVRKMAQPGIGILTVSEDGELKEVRRAKLGKISKSAWLDYLPVSELRKLLKIHGFSSPRAGDRKSIREICMRISREHIRAYALDYVKSRDQRNAALRAAVSEKVMLRRAQQETAQRAVYDWVSNLPTIGQLKAIPRKVG